MLKIRLSRHGKKKDPRYKIVIAQSTSPRDGKFIDCIGYYHPTEKEDNKKLSIDMKKLSHWLSFGAKQTDVILRICKKYQKSSV